MYSTAWPNASYSEKMPGHIDPYWVIVWTPPITSVPITKCSTWKLGQNGLICPFFRSFHFFNGIRGFFYVWLLFFSPKLMLTSIFHSYGYMLDQLKKEISSNWPNLASFKAFSGLRSISSRLEFFECMFKLFFIFEVVTLWYICTKKCIFSRESKISG